MALKTKKEIVQEILYECYGGIPNINSSISENFVLRKLNNKIASNAMMQAMGTYKMDGAICVDDIFTLTYTDIALTIDQVTGLIYTDVPNQPIGIPGNQSITVFPSAPRGGMLNDLFKPTTRKKLTMVRSLPNLKKVFHFIENGRIYFEDEYGIMATFFSGTTSLNISIITSGAQDMTAFLNMPDDMINMVKKECIAELKLMMSIFDATPLPPSDNPKPRQ